MFAHVEGVSTFVSLLMASTLLLVMKGFTRLLQVAQDKHHQCMLQLPPREEVKVQSKHMVLKNI